MKRTHTHIIFVLICLNALTFLFWARSIEAFNVPNSVSTNGVVVNGDIKILAERSKETSKLYGYTIRIIDTVTNTEVWNTTSDFDSVPETKRSNYVIISAVSTDLTFNRSTPPIPTASLFPTTFDSNGTKLIYPYYVKTRPDGKSYIDALSSNTAYMYVNGLLTDPLPADITYNATYGTTGLTFEKWLLSQINTTTSGFQNRNFLGQPAARLPNITTLSFNVINISNPTTVLSKTELKLIKGDQYLLLFNGFIQIVQKADYNAIITSNNIILKPIIVKEEDSLHIGADTIRTYTVGSYTPFSEKSAAEAKAEAEIASRIDDAVSARAAIDASENEVTINDLIQQYDKARETAVDKAKEATRAEEASKNDPINDKLKEDAKKAKEESDAAKQKVKDLEVALQNTRTSLTESEGSLSSLNNVSIGLGVTLGVVVIGAGVAAWYLWPGASSNPKTV
jgi:hypothetical protein